MNLDALCSCTNPPRGWHCAVLECRSSHNLPLNSQRSTWGCFSFILVLWWYQMIPTPLPLSPDLVSYSPPLFLLGQINVLPAENLVLGCPVLILRSFHWLWNIIRMIWTSSNICRNVHRSLILSDSSSLFPPSKMLIVYMQEGTLASGYCSHVYFSKCPGLHQPQFCDEASLRWPLVTESGLKTVSETSRVYSASPCYFPTDC